MNKLLILSIVLCLCCAQFCTSEVIPIAVDSHRRFDVETVNLDQADGGEPYNPSHIFEIEPSSSPLRLVFSSESSPLSLEVEKVFRDTPIHAHAPDAKQDRSGAVPADARPNNAGAGAYNEDEYEIVDSYSRYVPVKVRDNTEQVLSGSDADVVFVRPVKVVKPEKQQKPKKVRIPVIRKAEKTTTAKPPTADKQVAAVKPTVRTTPAEEMTSPATTPASKGEQENKEEAKFGERLTRQTKKEEKAEKTADKKAMN